VGHRYILPGRGRVLPGDACHVWDEAEGYGFEHDLYVFDSDVPDADGEARLRQVPLNGTIRRAKDPFDVAFIELDSSVVAALPSRHFLRLNEVALRPRPWGLCWVFGFPQESVEDIPTQALFRFNQFFALAPFCRREVALENYNPNVHFLLDLKREGLCSRDGTPADMPRRLQGISGCSIWQPEWPRGNSVENWNPNGTRIVGVQTSSYRGPSVIKATCWAAVASALYQCRPDLRGIIEFHLGPAW
jgi:hypothetical protein